jgi:hypothetical protein
MKRLSIAVLALLLVAGEALAITRRDVTNMTCEQIKAVLRAEGTAILRFRGSRIEGLTRWGLYVSDQAFCPGLQTLVKRRLRSTTGTCYVSQCVDNGQSLRR